MNTTVRAETEKRPENPRQETPRTAMNDHQVKAALMNKTTDPGRDALDRLDRLADSLRGYRTSSPLNREDLRAADVAEVEELAERFNVLPITVLFVAHMLADDSEDMITADVFKIFDTARRDARRMGLRLPQDRAREESGR